MIRALVALALEPLRIWWTLTHPDDDMAHVLATIAKAWREP